MTKEFLPIVALEELTPMCRPDGHAWRLVHADVLSTELRHKCSRCGAEKVGRYPVRTKPRFRRWGSKRRANR